MLIICRRRLQVHVESSKKKIKNSKKDKPIANILKQVRPARVKKKFMVCGVVCLILVSALGPGLSKVKC